MILNHECQSRANTSILITCRKWLIKILLLLKKNVKMFLNVSKKKLNRKTEILKKKLIFKDSCILVFR